MNFITYKNTSDKLNRKLENSIMETLRPLCYKHQITYLQYQILAVLFEEGSLNIGELSELMSMDTGNMSAQCKRLEKKGYTLRLRKKFDERVVDVSLTKQGRLTIMELNNFLERSYKNKWEEIDTEQRERLISDFKILNQIFSD